MEATEAARLLEVRLGASPDVLKAAYRSAIRRAHPDAGGSEEQAALINKAHDVLLAYEPEPSPFDLFNNLGV